MNVKVVKGSDGSAKIVVDIEDKDMQAMGQVALDRAIDLIASSMAKEFREKHGRRLSEQITETMEEMLEIAEDAVDEDGET